MDINFTYPDAALAAVFFFAVALLVLISIRLLRTKNLRGLSLHILRLTTLLFLALSAAGPHLEEKSDSGNIYALLDISDSTDEAVMPELLEKLNSYNVSGLSLKVFPFAGKTLTTALSVSNPDYRGIKQAWSRLDIGKTNIEAALASLERQVPGSIVLLTDGFETQGSASEQAAGLAAAGFKIFPLLPQNPDAAPEKLRISNLHAPLVARSGSKVEIKTSILNSTSSVQSGQLEIRHGDKVVSSRRVAIEAGREEVFSAESDPSQEGIREIRAIFKPDSAAFTDSARTIYLSGEKGSKVLIISGAEEDRRFLPPVLESQAYRLNNVLAAEFKANPTAVSEYKTIIFNNTALNQLPAGLASDVENFVEEGGNFIMIGGNRSFGLGGYINSAVADVLPVKMLPPQKEEKRLNVAVQLLIDKSRSMADGNRIDFAKEAAIEVVDNLKDDDYLGVMGFDVNPFVVLRLALLREIRSEAVRRIGLLYPNKGTSLVASIDEARRDLTRANAGRKHMLILTDGEITDAPKHYYFEMVKQVRLLGITVSTVMLGAEGDQSMLKQMADLGGGAFYRTNDARALPKIFISDLKVASGERTLKEQNEYAVRIGPAGLSSTTIESYPYLKGYVQTEIKPKGKMELVTIANNKAEPLLASWTYGKGNSIAFTSDANGRWSQDWIGWARFQTFWQNLIDSVQKAGSGSKNDQVRFDLATYYENSRLNIDLSIFSEEEKATVGAELRLPDGTTRKTNLNSIAPGRYLGAIEEPQAGRYELRAQIAGKDITPVAFDLPGEYLGEIKGRGFNMALLQNLAGISGGRVNPDIDELLAQKYTKSTLHDLSKYTILCALLLMLLEVLLREGALRFWPARINFRV